ncbi:MAG: nucleoside kinase [Lachnospiraceae bacterium]|nr:nucleoside kinase [Lachnospiraceae bacterium]
MIHVLINGERYEYPEGTTLRYIAEDLQSDYPQQIVLAFVGGQLRELFHKAPDGAELSFVTIADKIGAKTYERSVVFLMILAFTDTYGEDLARQLFVDYTISNGLLIRLRDGLVTDEMLETVTDRMNQLVKMDIPFRKESIRTREAVKRFSEMGMSAKAKLFTYRRASETNIYHLSHMQDYYYAYMVPSTGCLTAFKLVRFGKDDTFILQTPEAAAPDRILPYIPRVKLYETMEASTRWCSRLNLECAGDLNDWITHRSANDLVLIQEAVMEKRFGDIAEMIAASGKRIVLVAGPSSSGKTTFSHRLAVQLRSLGLNPHPIACDNYFLDRDKYPLDENGNADYEAISCIDIELLNRNFTDLLAGKTVELPSFNFLSGKQEFKGDMMKLEKGDVIILEGIHCLNDSLTYALPYEQKFRIYISALTQLNIDEHNRIANTDVRLLRRIVRDARTRGTSATATIKRWDSVRHGEENNIFPWQENADVIVNSALIYELPVLKSYAEPLLFGVAEDTPEYIEAKRLLKFLDYFLPVPTEEIPRNSIVREFIGGGCFDI